MIEQRTKTKLYVPIWEKVTLTIDEAAAYTNIGENRLRELIKTNDRIVIKAGTKNLIIRDELINLIKRQHEF